MQLGIWRVLSVAYGVARVLAVVVVLTVGAFLASDAVFSTSRAPVATYAVPGGSLTVYGDYSARYEPDHAGRDCSAVSWSAIINEHGSSPVDSNGDGLIDCGSDFELGS